VREDLRKTATSGRNGQTTKSVLVNKAKPIEKRNYKKAPAEIGLGLGHMKLGRHV